MLNPLRNLYALVARLVTQNNITEQNSSHKQSVPAAELPDSPSTEDSSGTPNDQHAPPSLIQFIVNLHAGNVDADPCKHKYLLPTESPSGHIGPRCRNISSPERYLSCCKCQSIQHECCASRHHVATHMDIRHADAPPSTEDCMVCLAPLSESDTVQCEGCSVLIHVHCLLKWLHEQEKCPHCKYKIFEVNTEGNPAAEPVFEWFGEGECIIFTNWLLLKNERQLLIEFPVTNAQRGPETDHDPSVVFERDE